jgi:hypothetical protein
VARNAAPGARMAKNAVPDTRMASMAGMAGHHATISSK